MSKASKEYQNIIKQLESLKDHCSEMAQDGDAPWKNDVAALQEAMDIIADYEKVVDQNNRMAAHYETAEMTIKRQAGIYVCPACGKRVQVGHTHCQWCGKKVTWDREAYASRDYPHLRGGRQ